jgi:serine/threonine-protein kinase
MRTRTSIPSPRRLVVVIALLLCLSPAATAVGGGDRTPVASASAEGSGPTFGSALRGSAPTGKGPSGVAVDPATHTAYVANGNNVNGDNVGGNTVSVIDTRRCRAVDVSACAGPWPTVTVGANPNTLAVDPSTHTVYVTNVLDNTVSVVDGRTCNGTVVHGCDQTPATVPVGASPTGIYVDTRRHSVYVGNFDDNTVSVFRSTTCNAIRHGGCPTSPPASFPVGSSPGDVDVNQRTHTAYVTTLTGLTAFDTRTCNATTQAGC